MSASSPEADRAESRSARGAGRAAAPATRAALLTLIAVGAALRFFRLGAQSFWYDETVSAVLGRHGLLALASGQERDLGNPPLYAMLVHLWGGLVGDGDAALRALAAVAGVLTLPLAYALARRLAGKQAALAATALLALAPFHIYFAQENRSFAWVTLFALASLLTLLRALERPRWVAAYVLATAAALYTHYYAFFLVLVELSYVLACRRRRLPLLAAALLAVALLYLPWVPALLAQATTQGNLARSPDSWILHGAATPLAWVAGTTLVWKGTTAAARFALAALAVAAAATAAVAGIRGLRRERGPLVLLLLWLGLPVVVPLAISAIFFPFYNVRYALFASPALYILMGAGLTRHRRLAWVVTPVLLAAATASLVTYFTRPIKPDWRAAVAFVERVAHPDDLLLFDADTNETVYARYAHGRQPRLRLLPRPQGTAGLFGTRHGGGPVADVTATAAAHDRIWLLASDPVTKAESWLALAYRPTAEERFRDVLARLWIRDRR